MDSVMFSHSDLISRWAVIVFASWYIYIFFLIVWLCYVSFMSNIFSTVLLNGFLIGRLFDRIKARQIAANALKLCKEAAMRR